MMVVHPLENMDGVQQAQTRIRVMQLGPTVDMEIPMQMNATIHSTTVDKHIIAVSVHHGVLLVSTETMITTHGNTVMRMIWEPALILALPLGLGLAPVPVLDLTLTQIALVHQRLSLERNVVSHSCTRDNTTILALQKTLETSHGVQHLLEMTIVSKIGIIASLPPHQALVDQDQVGLVIPALDLEEALPVVHQMVTGNNYLTYTFWGGGLIKISLVQNIVSSILSHSRFWDLKGE